MRILILLLLVNGCITGWSQGDPSNPFLNDANGQPLYLRTSWVPEGSPYFYDEYSLAEITTSSGKVYHDVAVKIDLAEKKVIYRDAKGEEMIATTPILQIKFPALIINGKAFPPATLKSVSGFINAEGSRVCLVLEEGKASLYKEVTVTYTDNKKYGEATITRTFNRQESYWVLKQGDTGLRKAEKNKSFLLGFLSDRQVEISRFIEDKKLKCKTIDDLVLVIRHYNMLG